MNLITNFCIAKPYEDQKAESVYDAECQADRSVSRFLGVLNSFDIVSMAFVWYYKTTHNASSQK